jgi:uncharacterized protein
METTVLFHANCPDGHAASYACWLRFKDTAQYLPVFYGQEPPDIPAEHKLYLVDFSYPEATLKVLLAERIGHLHPGEDVVTVLDHHESAQRDLASLQAQALPGLSIVFDMAESGASLTWKYLQTGGWHPAHDPEVEGLEHSMPLFFHYVRDRDLWHFTLPHSKAVSLAYWCVDKTSFLAIDQFAQALDDDEGFQAIVAEGQAMQRYADSLVKEQAARVAWGMIGDYFVPVVNATTLFSEVGDYLCTYFKSAAFCAYYFLRSDGKKQWGLRGRNGVDLSVVAKQYGGGGHTNAAGFVTEEAWTPWNQEKTVEEF